MDSIINTTNIDNYEEYLEQIYNFQNTVKVNEKKNIYDIYKIFDNKYIKKLKIDNKYLSFKSDEKPIFEYTKNFNQLIILKNKKLKQYLILEINLPFLNYYNKDLYNNFISKNYFFYLINNKNKILDDILDNEEYNKIKQSYENDKIKINKYNNSIIDNYNELFNLYIKELNINSKYNNIYQLYNQNKDKEMNFNILIFLNLLKNNYHYSNKKIGKIYDNKYYIKNENTLIKLNNDFMLSSNKYNKLSKSKIENPINDKILNFKNILNTQYLIDNSKVYDDNHNTSITLQLLNEKKYKEYISNKLLNDYTNNVKSIKKEKDKKPITINVNDNKYNNNIFIINNNNINLLEGEYLDEIHNKKSYKLEGYLWRNYLDNKNTNYTFVYKNLLFSSVNHCIKYLILNDDKYSLDYDNIYFKKKNKDNYIGYSENIIYDIQSYDDKDIILNKIIQNKELIDILKNTGDAILIDENNKELKSLMDVRKIIKTTKYSNIKEKYLEYNSFLKDYSNIVSNYLSIYDEDTYNSKEIKNEIKEHKLFEKYKNKLINLFEIIKYNYLL